jgi:Chaperone for flagella basal body P-ring formation
MRPTRCCRQLTTLAAKFLGVGTVFMISRAAIPASTILILLLLPVECLGKTAMCTRIAVEPVVEISRSAFTLADLLSPATCAPLRRAAQSFDLGATPRGARARIVPGERVRELIAEIAGVAKFEQLIEEPVPERIFVRRSARVKTCHEIAQSVLDSSSQSVEAGLSPANFDCAGAQFVPKAAALELTRTSWNASLHRWEFALRCTRSKECIPFLLSAHESSSWKRETVAEASGGSVFRSAMTSTFASPERAPSERVVKPGQTVTLRWDERGVRIVLPVTCLDGGAAGETVRVRFKSAPRVMRAEVLPDGTLRAGI